MRDPMNKWLIGILVFYFVIIAVASVFAHDFKKNQLVDPRTGQSFQLQFTHDAVYDFLSDLKADDEVFFEGEWFKLQDFFRVTPDTGKSPDEEVQDILDSVNDGLETYDDLKETYNEPTMQ